jgi:hypothetical protein
MVFCRDSHRWCPSPPLHRRPFVHLIACTRRLNAGLGVSLLPGRTDAHVPAMPPHPSQSTCRYRYRRHDLSCVGAVHESRAVRTGPMHRRMRVDEIKEGRGRARGRARRAIRDGGGPRASTSDGRQCWTGGFDGHGSFARGEGVLKSGHGSFARGEGVLKSGGEGRRH